MHRASLGTRLFTLINTGVWKLIKNGFDISGHGDYITDNLYMMQSVSKTIIPGDYIRCTRDTTNCHLDAIWHMIPIVFLSFVATTCDSNCVPTMSTINLPSTYNFYFVTIDFRNHAFVSLSAKQVYFQHFATQWNLFKAVFYWVSPPFNATPFLVTLCTLGTATYTVKIFFGHG